MAKAKKDATYLNVYIEQLENISIIKILAWAIMMIVDVIIS
ncbi:hypothetical protein [Eubacterium ramulus]|nr:hypothetical protein [Eubacterium ramulus]